jgi:hypothetical protein
MFIDELKQAYKLYSVWITAAIGALAAAEPYVPFLHEHFDSKWVLVAAVVVVAARLKKQHKLHKTSPQELFENAKKMAKVSLFCFVIALLGGCARAPKNPVDILDGSERDCVLKEKKRTALELAACGKNVDGTCATRSIYAASLERRLACVR